MKSLWFFLLLVPITVNCSVPIPIVGIEMGDAGFHRDLVYTVQFDYPLAGKDCEYILLQTLPAAVYVSVDQLDDLTRLKKLNAIYPKFVDVEMPAEKAEAFTVLLKGSPKITDKITLPIHFRYHAPSDKSTTVAVDIPAPTMYMSCPANDHDLVDNQLQPTPNIAYCLRESDCNFVIDAASHVEECNWKSINVDYHLAKALRADIPVGNAKAYPPILYATIIVSWVVSIWTVFRTSSVPRRINFKLEEQRILQNKAKQH